MDLATHDISCYLPLNRSGNILDINHRYKRIDYQFLLLVSLLVTSTFLYKKACRLVLASLLKLLLCSMLSLIVLPLIFVLLLVMAVYRQVVIVKQKLKLGYRYGGILLGPDAIWTVEDSVAKSIINVLLIVRSNEDGLEFYKRVEQQLKTAFFETPNKCKKVLGTFRNCSGYYFMKDNDVEPRECIRPLETIGNDELEKEELMSLLNKISNSELPKNHSAFWEVYIGTQNVKWSSKNKFFPVVFRVHHALGDGISLLDVLIHNLAERRHVTPLHLARSWTRVIQIYFRKMWILFQASYAVVLQAMVRRNDVNVLHGPKLSGEKIMVYASEKEGSCIRMIKDIKQNRPGVKFADVLIAAISGSLKEYYIKNSKVVPERITSVIPVLPGCGANEFDGKLGSFHNSYSVALLDIPISQKGDRLSESSNVLNAVRTETATLSSAVDYQVNYWILNVVSKYLPSVLLKPLIESTQATLVISNLPGPKRLALFEEYDVEDILFWIPHRGTTGLGISILSYDDRLQIGLNVDTALISKREDAQTIVDQIFGEIKKMSQAING